MGKAASCFMSNFIDVKLSQRPDATSAVILEEKGEGKRWGFQGEELSWELDLRVQSGIPNKLAEFSLQILMQEA